MSATFGGIQLMMIGLLLCRALAAEDIATEGPTVASIALLINRTEIHIEDSFNLRVVGYDSEGREIGELHEYTIESSPPGVVDEHGKPTGRGITELVANVNGVRSQSVMVSVCTTMYITVVSGSGSNGIQLSIVGGPNHWPGEKPPVQKSICDDGTDLQSFFFGGDISNCRVMRWNRVTERNPYPVNETAIINMSYIALSGIVLEINGSESSPRNLIQGSTVLLTAAGVNNKGEKTGEFTRPHTIFEVTQENGHVQRVCKKQHPCYYTVNRAKMITVKHPEHIASYIDVNTIYPISVESIPVLSSLSTEPFIAAIKGGSGKYTVEGMSAEIEGNKLIVFPTKDAPVRTIRVNDAEYPELYQDIEIKTSKPDRLVVVGSSYPTCAINDTAKIRVALYDNFGQKFSDTVFDQGELVAIPNTVKHSKGGELTFIPTEAGKHDITIKYNELETHLVVNAVEYPRFLCTNPKILVGDTKVLPMSFMTDEYKIISEDSTLLTSDGKGRVTGIQPGVCKLHLINVNKPEEYLSTIEVQIVGIKGLRVESPMKDPYVSCRLLLTAILITDVEEEASTLVSWQVDGSSEWERLQNGSVVITCQKVGQIHATASLYGHHKSISINVDYKLAFEKRSYLIPQGTSVTFVPTENIDVQYFVADDAIEKEFKGNTEGEFVVIARYKQQWTTIEVTVAKPSFFYLRSDGTSQFTPVLLDESGKVFDQADGLKVIHSKSDSSVLTDPSGYTIESLNKPVSVIEVECSTEFFTIRAVTQLFSESLIFPQDQIVQQGFKKPFQCHAPRPSWSSTNERSASVDESGVVEAISPGKTYIRCTPAIDTSLVVVQIEQLRVQKQQPNVYSVEPLFTDNSIDASKVVYASDLRFVCNWSANECGEAVYEDGKCVLTLHKRRICPSASMLSVRAISEAAHLDITQTSGVEYGNKIDWGIESDTTITLTKKHPSVRVPFRANRTSLATEVHGPLTVDISDPQFLTLSADVNELDDNSEVLIFNSEEGEGIRIRVRLGSYLSLPSTKRHHNKYLENILFAISVVITFILALYISRRLGAGNMLISNSPYKPSAVRN